MIEQLIAFAMGFALTTIPELAAFTKFNLIETMMISNDTLYMTFTKESSMPMQFYQGEFPRLWEFVRNLLKAAGTDIYVPEGGNSYNYAIRIENSELQKTVTFIELDKFTWRKQALNARTKAGDVAELPIAIKSDEQYQHSGIYEISFKSGKTLVEHGESEDDIRAFVARSYSSYGQITSIKEWRN